MPGEPEFTPAEIYNWYVAAPGFLPNGGNLINLPAPTPAETFAEYRARAGDFAIRNNGDALFAFLLLELQTAAGTIRNATSLLNEAIRNLNQLRIKLAKKLRDKPAHAGPLCATANQQITFTVAEIYAWYTAGLDLLTDTGNPVDLPPPLPAETFAAYHDRILQTKFTDAQIQTWYTSGGNPSNMPAPTTAETFAAYRARVRTAVILDNDDVLFAFLLLKLAPINENVRNAIRVFDAAIRNLTQIRIKLLKKTPNSPACINVGRRPESANITITTVINQPRVFTVNDFPFSDPNNAPPHTLRNVIILQLPKKGSLQLLHYGIVHGTRTDDAYYNDDIIRDKYLYYNDFWADFDRTQTVIPAADIAAGKLKYFMPTNKSGSDSFTFRVQDAGSAAPGSEYETESRVYTATIGVTRNKTITVPFANPYLFYPSDFGFIDSTGNPAYKPYAGPLAIKILTLPASGTLKLNGINVTANQYIPLTMLGNTFAEKTFTLTVANENDGPTITLSNDVIFENSTNTLVGTLAVTEFSSPDPISYTLTVDETNTPNYDNARFEIVDNQLRVTAPLDFETQNLYRVQIRATTASGLIGEKLFTITVTDVIEDFTLWPTSISEHSLQYPVFVGSFLTRRHPSRPGSRFHYELVSLPNVPNDNNLFDIVANNAGGTSRNLILKERLDFEDNRLYSITARSTEIVTEGATGMVQEKTFTISVLDSEIDTLHFKLSTLTIPENAGPDDTISTFSGGANGLVFAYTLVSGVGDTDNAAFNIIGNQLRPKTNLDFEAQSTYSIRARAENLRQLSYTPGPSGPLPESVSFTFQVVQDADGWLDPQVHTITLSPSVYF